MAAPKAWYLLLTEDLVRRGHEFTCPLRATPGPGVIVAPPDRDKRIPGLGAPGRFLAVDHSHSGDVLFWRRRTVASWADRWRICCCVLTAGSSSVDYRRENAKFCKELLSDVETSRYHEAAFDIRPVFCSVGSYCRGPSFVSTGRRESTRPINMVMSEEGYDSDRLVNNATKGEIEMPKHEGAEHHKKAAEHHDHAARHHKEAARHREEGSVSR